ncbi:YjcG family protein [Bacillaceae bacterium W0354]
MSKTTYGIAVFPSKKVQDIANSYRMRYDPSYEKIPPHITLKERFEASEVELEAMIKELNKLAKNMKPFEIEINKVSSFSPVTNTVYLKVVPHEQLDYLNDQLHQGVFPAERKYSFVPHITISQDLSDDEHSDVYGSLRMLTFDIKDVIDRFQLLYQLDNGSWTVYETFKFGE